jgi:hypothetical protein
MNLKSYCAELMRSSTKPIITDDDLGRRIMCPEYAIDHIDVKTFPTSEKNGIFILCWSLEEGGKLHAAIQSDQQPFLYQCEYTPVSEPSTIPMITSSWLISYRVNSNKELWERISCLSRESSA